MPSHPISTAWADDDEIAGRPAQRYALCVHGHLATFIPADVAVAASARATLAVAARRPPLDQADRAVSPAETEGASQPTVSTRRATSARLGGIMAFGRNTGSQVCANGSMASRRNEKLRRLRAAELVQLFGSQRGAARPNAQLRRTSDLALWLLGGRRRRHST